MKLYCGITDIGEYCIGIKAGKDTIKVGKNKYKCKNIKPFKEGKK